MVSDVIADPATLADGLRPVLLRLSRELRRETDSLGVTSRQVTLLWQIRRSPGLSLRELAREAKQHRSQAVGECGGIGDNVANH